MMFFDLTPVMTTMTLTVSFRAGSTAAPQMIRALGETFAWIISATFSASEMDILFAARDVHQGAGRPGDVDIDERES